MMALTQALGGVAALAGRCPRRRGRVWPSCFGVVGDVSDWRDPALLEQRERVRIDLDWLIQAGAR